MIISPINPRPINIEEVAKIITDVEINEPSKYFFIFMIRSKTAAINNEKLKTKPNEANLPNV